MELVQRWLTFAHVSRPLYFVKVDIKSCFDTIKQEKLLEIMESVVNCEEYVLHKYCELNMDQGKVRKRFSTRASATGASSQFLNNTR